MIDIEKLQKLARECRQLDVYAKIAKALQGGNLADAAIRIAQCRAQSQSTAILFERMFDPNELRDAKGRWTTNGNAGRDSVVSNTPSVGWCKIVKQLCIVEATDTLQTRDYGFEFFNAMNSCMARHGCLGVA